MTVARSVADVLDDHTVFEVESIDRMYLNVWQPRLAYGGGVRGFFVAHRGYHYASTALMDPMTKTFVADIHRFVAARGLELVHFAKGQRKDNLAVLSRSRPGTGPVGAIAEIHQQDAGLLGHPDAGGMGGDPGRCTRRRPCSTTTRT